MKKILESLLERHLIKQQIRNNLYKYNISILYEYIIWHTTLPCEGITDKITLISNAGRRIVGYKLIKILGKLRNQNFNGQGKPFPPELDKDKMIMHITKSTFTLLELTFIKDLLCYICDMKIDISKFKTEEEIALQNGKISTYHNLCSLLKINDKL